MSALRSLYAFRSTTRYNIYRSPCNFWKRFYVGRCMRHIHAFIIEQLSWNSFWTTLQSAKFGDIDDDNDYEGNDADMHLTESHWTIKKRRKKIFQSFHSSYGVSAPSHRNQNESVDDRRPKILFPNEECRRKREREIRFKFDCFKYLCGICSGDSSLNIISQNDARVRDRNSWCGNCVTKHEIRFEKEQKRWKKNEKVNVV